MSERRSDELFIPDEHALLPTEEQLRDLGIRSLTRPKELKPVGDVQLFQQEYTMSDGWRYLMTTSVLPPEKRVTPVSVMSGSAWFTNEKGFNRRWQAAQGKLGAEQTFISVPRNLDRGWGDMEANSRNGIRIGKAAAIIYDRDQNLFMDDGVSRRAMLGGVNMSLGAEEGVDFIYGDEVVPCQFEGVDGIQDIEQVFDDLSPGNLYRAIKKGELPESLTITNFAKIAIKAKRAIPKLFGNEGTPITEMFTDPIKMLREGEPMSEVVRATANRWRLDKALGVPYEKLIYYPLTGDILPHGLYRQLLELRALSNGSYGKFVKKGMRPHQFQTISGFRGDGLSEIERVEKALPADPFEHTIFDIIEEGRHLSVVLEESHQRRIGRWATIIPIVGELEGRLQQLRPPERAAELHRRAAAANPDFQGRIQHIPEIRDVAA